MLAGKKILIISPQSWGKMFLSKHHYALELARYGASVYFLNPPEQTSEKQIDGIVVEASPLHPGLHIISHRLRFPYALRFKLPKVFHWLMRFHVSGILRHIGEPDIVWSFDLGNLYPLSIFPGSAKRVFHPVDEPLNASAIEAAKGAEIIFSVTREILDKYAQYPVPRIFINHGVSDVFIGEATGLQTSRERIIAGVSGNFLRPDIDREIFIQIIRENPGVDFYCWGSFELGQSNIGGGEDAETIAFIRTLKALPNVKMFGPVSSSDLAKQLSQADIFLICYDVRKDQSRGTNYHKIMEYLATGKPIVSNNVTTYKGKPELVIMVEEREHNRNLPLLFSDSLKHIRELNSEEMQADRRRFTMDNTYRRQIMRIEKHLEELIA